MNKELRLSAKRLGQLRVLDSRTSNLNLLLGKMNENVLALLFKRVSFRKRCRAPLVASQTSGPEALVGILLEFLFSSMSMISHHETHTTSTTSTVLPISYSSKMDTDPFLHVAVNQVHLRETVLLLILHRISVFL